MSRPYDPDIVDLEYREMVRDRLLERPLPNSAEAERAILGAIILDNALYYQARDYGIFGGVFYVPSHRRVWDAMTALVDRNVELNPITIGEELRRQGDLESVGGITFVSNLFLGLPHFANIRHYADIVMGKHNLRLLIKVCNMITSQALEEEDEPEKVLTDAESGILELVGKALRGNSQKRPLDFVHINTDKQEFAVTLEKRSQGLSDAIPTGIKPYDDKLEGGGLNPQGFYLVAADPKAGKTSLVLGIAERAAKWFQAQGTGKSVVVASLEMRRMALEMRMYSAYTGIPFDTLSRPGKLRGVEKELAFASMDGFFGRPLYINDAVFSIPEFWRACERAVYGPQQAGLIIADYLQLFSLKKGHSGDPESLTGETTLISRELKHIAQELNVPLIGISSLSRLGELRQSGQLDYDVEALIRLENPAWNRIKKMIQDRKGDDEVTQEMRRQLDAEPIWDINARLAYQRNGPTGDVMLKFLRKYMQFVTHEEYEMMIRGPEKRSYEALWEQTK